MKILGENLFQTMLTKLPEAIDSYIKSVCETSGYVKEDDIKSFIEPYEDYFGGHFILVESLDDLKEIPVINSDTLSSDRPTLFDSAGRFDYVEAIEGFMAILAISNNSGGNTYFIPEEFWTQNVLNSLIFYEEEI